MKTLVTAAAAMMMLAQVPAYAGDVFVALGNVDGEMNATTSLTLASSTIELPAVIDTGATDVSMSLAEARRFGFDPSTLPANATIGTANGEARVLVGNLSRVCITDPTGISHKICADNVMADIRLDDNSNGPVLIGLSFFKANPKLSLVISGGTAGMMQEQ